MRPAMRLWVWVLFACGNIGYSLGQGVGTEEQLTESRLEPQGSSEQLLSDLNIQELVEHPIHINSASLEELMTTGVLTSKIAAAIVAHRIRFGPLVDLRELQVVDGIDSEIIRQLLPYVTLGYGKQLPQGGWRRMVSEGNQQVLMRMQFTPEEKSGYSTRYGRPAYEGSPLGCYLRYRFESMGRLRWGITAEKDPGEPFFKGSRKDGFDFYSLHFAIRDVGRIRTLALGDYSLSYGQGVVFSNGGRGTPADPCMILTYGNGIRPYTSVGESGFFRGAAVSLAIGNQWHVDVFGSSIRKDANTYAEVDSLVVFSSFQTSGLHRTWYERADRKSLSETMIGAALGFSNRFFKFGVVGYGNRYSNEYQKTFATYNRFDFRGQNHLMGSAYFNGLIGNLNFFSEFAYDQRGSKGFSAGGVLMVSPGLGVVLSGRHYDIGFHNPYGAGPGIASRNNAEQGWLAGLTMRPNRSWTLLASIDRCRFTWLRYEVSAPSSAMRFNATITYKPSKKQELSIRIRKSVGFNDAPTADDAWTAPVKKSDMGIRFQITSSLSKTITLRTRIERKSVATQQIRDQGYLFYQDLLVHPFGSRFSGNIRYAWFDTDGYDSRVYAYENDVLYGYSIPSYYYRGTRMYGNIQYKLAGQTTVWVKYAVTWFANRGTIGSGYEEITGSRKSELKIQFRFEF